MAGAIPTSSFYTRRRAAGATYVLPPLDAQSEVDSSSSSDENCDAEPYVPSDSDEETGMVELAESDESSQTESDTDDPEVPSTSKKSRKKTYKWKKSDINEERAEYATFTQPADLKSPLQFFRFYFDEHFITFITGQTNLYSM